MIRYGQNRSVIPLVAVTVFTWHEIEAPYCREHGEAFRRKWAAHQACLWASFLIACGCLYFLAAHQDLGFDKNGDFVLLGKIVAGLGAGALICSLYAMFVAKPGIYDMRVDPIIGGHRISAKSRAFVDGIHYQDSQVAP
jgi:hypothetical protein